MRRPQMENAIQYKMTHRRRQKRQLCVCVWRKSLLVLVCAEHHNYNTHIHNSLFAMTLTIPLSLCLSCAHLSVPWMAHLKGAPHTYTKQASPADTIALNENWLQFSWIIQMQVCVCVHTILQLSGTQMKLSTTHIFYFPTYNKHKIEHWSSWIQFQRT